MKKALKIAGILTVIIVSGIAMLAGYVKLALPNTGPAPKLSIAQTPGRLERGKYLANHVTICMDCHSKRDWSLFAGPVIPGTFGGGGELFNQDMGFPGQFYSKNISPAGIRSWTDGELVRAITTGVNKNNKALFPLMPYLHYGTMDSEDVYSIVTYLRSLQPVENTVPASKPDFPVNFLINTMPRKAAYTQRPIEDHTPQYGQYLVNAAGCIDCHSRREKGEIVPGSEFGGGMEFRQPGGIVRTANITPDPETGIGDWTEEAFIQRFKTYADSSYHPLHLGPKDLNTPMPWTMYAGMKASDLAAIYTYLRSLKPISNKVQHFEPKR